MFGAAADDGGGSHRSLVRFRLNTWAVGDIDKWDSDTKIPHKEVGKDVGAELYLGFGPLTYGETGKTNAKGFPIKDTILSPIKGSENGQRRTAINIRANARLCLMFSAELESELRNALQLAAWFGTLGSRSRNGWGALHLSGENIESIDSMRPAKLEPFSRNVKDCLQLDWPHAVGKDGKGPLVWKTKIGGSWRDAMRELARIKIEFRTKPKLLSFEKTADGVLAGRQILAYPVTNHAVLGPVNSKEKVAGWVELDVKTGKPKTDKRGKYIQSARLANQIRFKVIPGAGGKLFGLITHLPCKLPDTLFEKLSPKDRQFVRDNELAIWQQVHMKLDELCERL